MKKTKIICSIGPSTQSWENFKGLVEAGMNVARINFSHATLEERKLDESLVLRAREELGAPIAILYDTKGPDLRTCTFDGDYIELVEGSTIRIVEEDLKDKGVVERRILEDSTGTIEIKDNKLYYYRNEIKETTFDGGFDLLREWKLKDYK